jgi:glycosyltransferase involved in cell wall biosynthesis
LLQASDVFLLTSLSEGMPLAVIEAMAAGLPVVATNVGGIAEVVDADRTGLLAPPGHADQLAEAVSRLAENVPLRRAMGQRGRERAHVAFGEERMIARYSAIYREMLTPGTK